MIWWLGDRKFSRLNIPVEDDPACHGIRQVRCRRLSYDALRICMLVLGTGDQPINFMQFAKIRNYPMLLALAKQNNEAPVYIELTACKRGELGSSALSDADKICPFPLGGLFTDLDKWCR